MFLDARAVADGSLLDADVCVVGAGAAGITIARELARTRLDVLVLESGGLEADARTQALARGRVAGHAYPPLESTRLRVFGGTTMHWNGWCRPLDGVDFERRRSIPHSGWPIGPGDLAPYYSRAEAICELGGRTYAGGEWSAGGELLRLGPEFVTTVFQFSPPTRFGIAYRGELGAASRVRVLLHANAVRIRTSASGGVERLDAATLSGRRFGVRAARYVLACGGIENARLLLASNIGERAGPVGRFFAEHPHSPVALAVLPDPVDPVYAGVTRGQTPARGALATGAHLARSGLLRASMTLDPIERDPYVDRDDDREQRLAAFGRDLASVGRSIEPSQFRVYGLYLRSEQAPNPDSRVTLASDRDVLGVPRARLEWRLTDLDRRSASRTLRLLAETMGRRGLGRLYIRPDSDEGFWDRVGGGYHHIGTTRMGAAAATSVVDRNCRLHAVDNLYVAGSSVFSTTGYANPTLTIVALALRLADHLARVSP